MNVWNFDYANLQERLLGAALGSMLTGVVVLEQRKRIYKSISENQSRFSPQSQVGFNRFDLSSLSQLSFLIEELLPLPKRFIRPLNFVIFTLFYHL